MSEVYAVVWGDTPGGYAVNRVFSNRVAAEAWVNDPANATKGYELETWDVLDEPPGHVEVLWVWPVGGWRERVDSWPADRPHPACQVYDWPHDPHVKGTDHEAVRAAAVMLARNVHRRANGGDDAIA